MRRLAVALGLLGTACAPGEPGTPGSGSEPLAAADPAFCASALGAVEEWLGPVPAPSRAAAIVGGGVADLEGGMNAFAAPLEASVQHQLHVNLMSLVRFDEQFQAEPYLAESWELSEDGASLTFTLRDDVYWHDGTRTTAEDVAFTFERARNPESGFPNTSYFRYYHGVEVLDPRTVRFALEPHSQTLDTWAVVPIMPAHLLADVPVTELAAHPFGTRCPVGNGPFRFAEHRESDRWVFVPNPRFPAALGGPPAMERYVFRVIPDQTTLATELMAGNVHIYFDVPPDQVGTLQGAEGVRVMRSGSRTFESIMWNTRRPALSDARVRRALTRAIDREAIVQELVLGYGRVAESSVPPFHWGYASDAGSAVAYDPAAAQGLLEEAGGVDRDGDGVRENQDGTPLRLEVVLNEENQLRRLALEVAQASLAAVGVELEIQPLEFGAMVGRVAPGERDFDGLVLGYSTDFRIDDAGLFHSDRSEEMMGFAGLADARIDHLIDSLQVVRDRDDARAMWARYQRALVQVQPFTYLFFPDILTGVSTRLENVEIDERGAWYSIRDWTLGEAPGGA